MSGLILNLQNHTPFSDGAYTIDEICDAHLRLRDPDLVGVGFSDNLFRTPTSREPADERDFDRLFGRETRTYVATLDEARRRWSDRLQIYCGAEINWPLNRSYLNVIRGMLQGFDYVLFSFVDWAGLTTLANQARRWPCPVGLAGCDVAARFPATSPEQVVRTLANARIFYTLSAGMMPRHEHDPWFRLLPQHRVLVGIGSDTHDDLACLRQLRPMADYLERRGLHDRMLRFGARRQEALTA